MVNNKVYSIIFLLVTIILACFVLAFDPDPTISNSALIAPIAKQNISGSFLLNVSAAVYSTGGNFTRVNVSFIDSSNNLPYNVTLTDKTLTINRTFNVTLNSALFTDGLFNISISAQNASDGVWLTNNSVFKSSSQFIFIDDTVPAVTLNTPVARINYTTGETIVFNASVSNVSGTAIDRVIFQVSNGTTFNLTASNSDATNVLLFNASVTVATMWNGNWTVTVYSNDTAGNMNNSVTTTFVVDTTAPGQPLLINMTQGLNISDTTPTFSWRVNDSLTTSLLCNLSIDSAVNVSGISSLNNSVTNYTITTALVEGAHNWSVACSDSVLLNSASILNNFTVDSLGTTSTISLVNSKTASGSWSNNRTLVIDFSANDSNNIAYWNISLFNSSVIRINSTQYNLKGNISAQVSYAVDYDDNFIVNLTVVDNSSFINISSFEIYIDTVSPSVGEVSVTEITSSGGTLNTASADDNAGLSSCTYSGAGTGTVVANTATLSSLTASTTYTVTVTCTDNAGNTGTGSTSFTTERASSGSGSTGSSGSSSAGTIGQFAKEVWTSINQGETATVDVENGAIGFTEIDFKLKETVWGPWVKVERKNTLPSNVKSLDTTAYRYVEVTTGLSLKAELIEDRVISFKVEKAWLVEKGVSPVNMALFRYVNNEWVELTTTLGQDDGTYVHYTAETPGFSYFAIGQTETETVAEVAVETEETVVDASTEVAESVPVFTEDSIAESEDVVGESKSMLWPWILGVAILVVLIVLSAWYVGYRKREKKVFHPTRK